MSCVCGGQSVCLFLLFGELVSLSYISMIICWVLFQMDAEKTFTDLTDRLKKIQLTREGHEVVLNESRVFS